MVIKRKKIYGLTYVDEIVVIARSEEEMIEIIRNVETKGI